MRAPEDPKSDRPPDIDPLASLRRIHKDEERTTRPQKDATDYLRSYPTPPLSSLHMMPTNQTWSAEPPFKSLLPE